MPESKTTAELKSMVTKRARGCCEYCQSQEAYSPDAFSVEHVIPLSKEGKTELDNLAFSCQGCNNHKYTAIEAVDPITGLQIKLFHPRRDTWTEHFAWNEDASLIIGLSSTGRATVERLKLNRKGVVNLRRVLATLDLHPPESI
jgi:hypothetical protein